MKYIATFAIAFGLSLSAFAYTSLEELMTDMNRRQVEAIKAYLAANPEAHDAAEARDRLVFGLVSIEDYDGAVAILSRMYDQLPQDKSTLELDLAFGDIVVPKIQILRMNSKKAEALAFIERVRADFSTHDAAPQIEDALNDFANMFEGPEIGGTMDIAFTALDGRDVDLAALKGQVVLVDFWATWCMPCIRVMPTLKELHAAYHDQGFEIIGISLDEERERLESYLAKENIAWPQHFDGLGWENEFALRYNVQSIPATALIGKDGKIVAIDPKESTLKELIPALLAAH